MKAHKRGLKDDMFPKKVFEMRRKSGHLATAISDSQVQLAEKEKKASLNAPDKCITGLTKL